MLIGEGYYSLKAQANFIDNPTTVILIASTFEVHEKLEYIILLVNPGGFEDLDLRQTSQVT